MKPYYEHAGITIYNADAMEALRAMPDESVDCCITSPPYWGLRDYGVTGQIGLEATPQEYISKIVAVLEEVRRVLVIEGTVWLNLGDSYAGSWGNQGRKDERGTQRPINGKMIQPVRDGRYADKISNTGKIPDGCGLKPKDLVGIPWRVAFALQKAGWWLRSDIIWAKPAPMPESVTDRPTRSHEYIFLLAKSEKYYCDMEAIKEPSVADHPSGNGYKREVRLTFADENGVRGSDIQWQPKSWNGSKFDGQRDLLIHPNVGRKRGESDVHGNLPGRGDMGAACNKPSQESRNKRDVWTVNTDPFPGAHFATFPPALILPCVLAGCPTSGTILDPFMGAATTALVAKENGRRAIGCELNAAYCEIAAKRLSQEVMDFGATA